MESTSIDELIQHQPADILRRIDGDGYVVENWELLREVARSRAINSNGREDKLAWAAVVKRAVEFLDGESVSLSVVSMRAKLISQLGSRAGDPILDLDDLWTGFKIRVDGLDADDVWPLEDSTVEELRIGRGIKNHLTALAAVLEDPRCADAAGELVNAWWSRRATLP